MEYEESPSANDSEQVVCGAAPQVCGAAVLQDISESKNNPPRTCVPAVFDPIKVEVEKVLTKKKKKIRKQCGCTKNYCGLCGLKDDKVKDIGIPPDCKCGEAKKVEPSIKSGKYDDPPTNNQRCFESAMSSFKCDDPSANSQKYNESVCSYKCNDLSTNAQRCDEPSFNSYKYDGPSENSQRYDKPSLKIYKCDDPPPNTPRCDETATNSVERDDPPANAQKCDEQSRKCNAQE